MDDILRAVTESLRAEKGDDELFVESVVVMAAVRDDSGSYVVTRVDEATPVWSRLGMVEIARGLVWQEVAAMSRYPNQPPDQSWDDDDQ